MKLTPTASVPSFDIENTAPKILSTNMLVRNIIVEADFVLVATLSSPSDASQSFALILRFSRVLHYHVVDDADLCSDLINVLNLHTCRTCRREGLGFNDLLVS